MTDLAHYYFVPTVREGLAAYITSTPQGERAQIQAQLSATIDNQAEIPTAAEAPEYSKNIALYGPGDVLGFDAAVVTRTDPRPNVSDFEPNFMPIVEFSEPDLPWRFTPSFAADATSGRLTPWLTLIVLKDGEFEGLGERLPKEDQKNALPIRWMSQVDLSALPVLAHAWKWAHVQVTADEIAANGDMPAMLANMIATDQEDTDSHVVARLICPRRLAPTTRYTAFVVPTFKLGLQAAGFDALPSGADPLTPAWVGSSGKVDLPYYYTWQFATSVRGDFEYLVRLLEARELPKLGKRRIDCSRLPYDLSPCPSDDASDPEVLELEGALISPDPPGPAKWHDGSKAVFQSKLADVLNLPTTLLSNDSTTSPTPPVVPPVFGRRHSGHATVTSAAASLSHWQNDVNLDPRQRVSAGFGAHVVEKEQEPLMASLWDQLGEIETANEVVYSGQLGLAASQGLFNRLGVLSLADFLWTTAPVFPRVRCQIPASSARTAVTNYLNGSRLPAAAFDPAFRRVLRGRGGIRKKQKRVTLPSAGNDILSRLNSGDFAAAGPPPKLLGVPSMCGVTEATIAKLRRNVKVPPRSVDAFRIFGRVIDRATRLPVANARVEVWSKEFNDHYVVHTVTDKRGVFLIDILRKHLRRWLDDGRPEVSFRVFRSEQQLKVTVFTVTKNVKGEDVADVLIETVPSKDHNETHAQDFCEEAITCDAVMKAISEPVNLRELQKDTGIAICSALTDWLLPQRARPEPAPADLNAVYSIVKAAITPSATIPARIAKRIRLGPGTHQRGALGRIESEVEFLQPMYEPLAAISQDLILPGVETVPQNTISILKSNRRFIEAYMLGLNDSLAGEVLWRGAPVYLWTTFFRQFWDVRGLVEQAANPELSKDIKRLTTWESTTELGHHDPRNTGSGAPPPDQAVLLVRGDLLKRYPNTLIYAVASLNGKPALDEYAPGITEQREWPIFSGSLAPDLTFLGFSKSPNVLCTGGSANEGYFIVLEERLGEPRFGFDLLDEGLTTLPPLTGQSWWYDMTWDHFQPLAGENEYINERAPATLTSSRPWGSSSAVVANICLQRPVRIAIHASKMLSEAACRIT